MMDPLFVIGIAALVAVGIVAAAVPKARTWALVALGAIAAFLGLRGLDRLLLGRRQEPMPPKPDKEQARLDAKEEAKAVKEAQGEAAEAAPVRETPPDLDALAKRVNERMDER